MKQLIDSINEAAKAAASFCLYRSLTLANISLYYIVLNFSDMVKTDIKRGASMLARYKNGNYIVTLLSDGTKIRMTNDDDFVPAFAENCDVKITDKCSVGCPFCYENCTPEGKHCDITKYQKLIDSLHAGTELALNGNDMDHPQLIQLLEMLKERHIFANITVNQSQFMRKAKLLTYLQRHKLLWGIGISYMGGTNVVDEVKRFGIENAVFHTIAGITTEEMYNELADAKQKVLVLGYKDRGRGHAHKGAFHDDIERHMTWLKENIMRLSKECSVVSFDNLALEQLDIKSMLPAEVWEECYMGDDGDYTFYMDLVAGTYSRNSINDRALL